MTEAAVGRSIFFVPGVGLISQIDPYAVLGLRPDAGAEEVARCLEEGPETWASEREALARDILGSPERRLAWHLLGSEAVSPARVSSQPMRFPSRPAMSAARGLLYEALYLEGAGELPRAEALWPQVDQAWLDLAGEVDVRRLMVGWARELGLAEPELVVGAVLEAIAAELLPWLHASLAVGAPEEHCRFHRRLCRSVARVARQPPAALLLRVARQELAAALRYRGRASQPVLEAYLEALEIAGPEETSELGTGLGDWCWEQVDAGAPLPVDQVRRAGDCLGTAAKRFPYDLDLRRALAKAWLCLGLAILREQRDFGEVLLYFNRASVLDPMNPDASQLWEAAYDVLVRDCFLLRDVPFEELTPQGRAHLWQAENASLLADCFPESPEGRALAEDRERASEGQVAKRLGLPVPSGLEVTHLLIRALASWDRQDASFERLRERCIAAEPRLACASWTLLKALALAGPITASLLALRLPPERDVGEGAEQDDAMAPPLPDPTLSGSRAGLLSAVGWGPDPLA